MVDTRDTNADTVAINDTPNADTREQGSDTDLDNVIMNPNADLVGASQNPNAVPNVEDETGSREHDFDTSSSYGSGIEDDESAESASNTDTAPQARGAPPFLPAEESMPRGMQQPIRFDAADVVDPNLVVLEDCAFLESDGERSEDSVEVRELESVLGSDDESDSDEVAETAVPFQAELQRVASAIGDAGSESLRLHVAGSSEIFDDTQLDDMAVNGWNILPENAVAVMSDDAEADKMYEGYCGPSRDIIPLPVPLYSFSSFFCRSHYGATLQVKAIAITGRH